MKAHASIFSSVFVFLSGGHLFAAERIEMPSCEYTVEYPETPTYTKKFDPNFGEYLQAKVDFGDKKNGVFVRSECVPIDTSGIKNSEVKPVLFRMIQNYANSNGLRNSEYSYEENDLGNLVRVRGFKSIDDIMVTYEAHIYLGDRSMMSLYAGGVSTSYPQKGVFEFLQSARR